MEDNKISQEAVGNILSDETSSEVIVTSSPVTLCPDEEFFQKIGAWTVFVSFGEALQSGNIEEFGHQLEPQAFSGILVMPSVHYHKDKEQDLLLKFLKKYVIGSKCDLVSFTHNFGLEETHQATLQHAMWDMMYIFEKASEVDQPANMVAEAIQNAYESGIWDEGVFYVLSGFLKSQYSNLMMVALVIVTALADLCTERTSKILSTVIHKTKIVDVMFKMDFLKLPEDLKKRATLCSLALGGMPNPSEFLIAAAGAATALGSKVQ